MAEWPALDAEQRSFTLQACHVLFYVPKEKLGGKKKNPPTHTQHLVLSGMRRDQADDTQDLHSSCAWQLEQALA